MGGGDGIGLLPSGAPAHLRCAACPTSAIAVRRPQPICRHGGTADGKAQARHTPGWPLDGVRPADGRHKRRHLHRTGQPPRSAPADQRAADAAERQPSARPARPRTARRFRARSSHPAPPCRHTPSRRARRAQARAPRNIIVARASLPLGLRTNLPESNQSLALSPGTGSWAPGTELEPSQGAGDLLPDLPLGFSRGPGSVSRLTCTPGWP